MQQFLSREDILLFHRRPGSMGRNFAAATRVLQSAIAQTQSNSAMEAQPKIPSFITQVSPFYFSSSNHVTGIPDWQSHIFLFLFVIE